MPTHPAQTRSQGSAEGIQVGRAVIRELARFDVAPQRLDRVQVGGVGGQALDGEPGVLSRHVGTHPATGVGAEPVPQQDDPPPAEVAFEARRNGTSVAVV